MLVTPNPFNFFPKIDPTKEQNQELEHFHVLANIMLPNDNDGGKPSSKTLFNHSLIPQSTAGNAGLKKTTFTIANPSIKHQWIERGIYEESSEGKAIFHAALMTHEDCAALAEMILENREVA